MSNYQPGDRIAFPRPFTLADYDPDSDATTEPDYVVATVVAYDFQRDIYRLEIDGQDLVLIGSFVRDHR